MQAGGGAQTKSIGFAEYVTITDEDGNTEAAEDPILFTPVPKRYAYIRPTEALFEDFKDKIKLGDLIQVGGQLADKYDIMDVRNLAKWFEEGTRTAQPGEFTQPRPRPKLPMTNTEASEEEVDWVVAAAKAAEGPAKDAAKVMLRKIAARLAPRLAARLPTSIGSTPVALRPRPAGTTTQQSVVQRASAISAARTSAEAAERAAERAAEEAAEREREEARAARMRARIKATTYQAVLMTVEVYAPTVRTSRTSRAPGAPLTKALEDLRNAVRNSTITIEAFNADADKVRELAQEAQNELQKATGDAIAARGKWSLSGGGTARRGAAGCSSRGAGRPGRARGRKKGAAKPQARPRATRRPPRPPLS
jgi:hypothetical protein